MRRASRGRSSGRGEVRGGATIPKLRLTDDERAVVDAIDRYALLECLQELIATPTAGGHEAAGQDRVASRMTRNGLAIDRWTFDVRALKSHPSFSMEVERREAVGLVGRMGGDRGRSLILNGHIDVVPAGDAAAWTVPPWQATLQDDRVYGRGAADMKGGLCCALFAAKAIRDAGFRLRGQLLIESVVGEEDGGVGTLAASLRGYRADGAVVLEPTQLKVAPAQAGALSFRITIPGLAAHASIREEGVSAIEKFLPIYDALRSLERRKNQARKSALFKRYTLPYALSIGTIRAGVWPSSVPESLVVEGRYGVAIDEKIPVARRKFEDAVHGAAKKDPWLNRHPPAVEWWGGQFGPARVPLDEPVVRLVEDAFCDANGRHTTLEGMPYGSDMRLLLDVAKTPTVLFGPGDVRQAHGPDEFVPVEDLMAATRTVAVAALRFCGYGT